MGLTSLFNRVKTIPDPVLTKENWGELQPLVKVKLAGKEFYFSQPSSTFWVYFLGVIVTIAGVYFLAIQEGELSRYWWGISLILWGVGAIIAGTSYQAFGYELKCARKEVCQWTSWWEVIYVIFQQLSMNAMTVAIAYSCTTGVFREVLIWYSLILTIVYPIIVFYGAFTAKKYLLTFEFMVLACLPSFILFCILNVVRYFQFGDPMDLFLIGSWVLIYLSWWGCEKYIKAGITEILWKEGIWFSSNDVLHVVLVIWGFYLFLMAPYIRDYASLLS